MTPDVGKMVSLEVVEVELALGAQDIVVDGFAGALQKAADLVSGEVIFNIRAPDESDQQRVAALSVPDGIDSQTALVMLANDGTTMTVASDQDQTTLRERLGPNFAAVMRGLRSSMAHRRVCR